MPIGWNLRMMMAQRGIWTGVDLKKLIEEKTTLRISSAGISRLLQDGQAEIKLNVLDALCTVLQCKPNELLVLETKEKAVRHINRA